MWGRKRDRSQEGRVFSKDVLRKPGVGATRVMGPRYGKKRVRSRQKTSTKGERN